MVYTRGSRSRAGGLARPGLTNDEIQELISTKVIAAIQVAILEVFRSIKTMMVELFDE